MKVAVLGLGGAGGGAVKHLLEAEGVSAVVGYDTSAEKVQEKTERFGIAASTQLETVLDDPDIALAFITASNDAHEALTVACLEAGKAVMCEKPMAITLEGARRMVETAERLGGWLQIGFELRYSKLYMKIKEWIDAGLLGEVLNTLCLYTSSAGRKAEGNWRLRTATSGSMMGEKLSHYVDLPRWWVGSPVTEVYAQCAPQMITYMEMRDNYHMTYRFESGASSHLTFLAGHPSTFRGDPLQPFTDQQIGDGHELRYLVVGSKGAAEADVFLRAIKRWDCPLTEEGLQSEIAEQLTWTAPEDHFYYHNTTHECWDVVRRVREGLPPATPARDAYDTTRLCFAADLSADTGQVVKLADVV